MAKKSPWQLDVAGKTFKFNSDDSELQAYMDARRYLKTLHKKAVERILPAPGSQRASQSKRQYDTETGSLYPNNPHYKGSEYDKGDGRDDAEVERKGGNVTLKPRAARVRSKGS